MALREWIDYMSISGSTPYLPIVQARYLVTQFGRF